MYERQPFSAPPLSDSIEDHLAERDLSFGEFKEKTMLIRIHPRPGVKGTCSTTVSEAVHLFRSAVGVDQQSPPPASFVLSIDQVVSLVVEMLGSDSIQVVFRDGTAPIISTTDVGIVRACWQAAIGGPENTPPDRLITTAELEVFLDRVLYYSQLRQGTLDELHSTVNSATRGTPVSPTGRRSWDHDPAFLMLDQVAANGSKFVDALWIDTNDHERTEPQPTLSWTQHDE